MSAFEIPTTKEAKLICQDPQVSIAVMIITILGIAVYLYKVCSKMATCMIMCALYTYSSVMIAIMSLLNSEN